MKYRTTLVAKAEVIEPKSSEFKAVAASLQDRYGFDLKPQMDLLYSRACLVSAGEGVGVNDNDDIFTREEAWAARHTPVLKPFNWQHQDKDILGVIYTVQARDTQGNILDITDDTPPDCDFDLWVESAIFRLIHEDRAAEIEARSKAGTLFVSMEAWFDDYSYGLFEGEERGLAKVVTRNKNTAFLDQNLRVAGGTGVYRDPESNQDMRIGRVLRSITFGGCGFVDRPANKRSVIEAAEPMNSLKAEQTTESQVELLLQQVMDFQSEETLMNTQANSGDAPEKVLSAAVNTALDEREKAAAERQERETLVARASELENQNTELLAKVEELTQAQEVKQAEVEALESQLEQYGEAVDKLVQDQHTSAGATNDTPAEIASIDSASDGDAAFAAKIAWIQRSMAGMRDRVTVANDLEAQLAEAEAVVREQEVRNLLGNVVSEEALETFVSHAATLDEDGYANWRDEKELMLLEIDRAGAADHEDKEQKGMPPALKEKMAKKKGKEEKDAKANLFEALLIQRRSESGTATMDTMRDNPNEPDLINHPGDGTTDVHSGVGPEALRTPRHKIAGSAGDNPTEALENAQAEGGVSLAGAQTSDDGAPVNPYRVLAGLVVNEDSDEEDSKSQDGPGFDPVR